MSQQNQEEFTFKPLTQGLGFRNSMLGASSETLPPLREQDTSLKSILKPSSPVGPRLNHPHSEYEIAPAKFELLAGVLDSLFVTTGFIVFLISLVSITGVDLNQALAPIDASLILSLIATYGFVGFAYLFLSRLFLGSTFGEWAFDQILGTPSQQQKKSYYGFLLLRSAVSAFSGFFLIPSLTLLTKIDLFSTLTPLKLWQVNGTRYIRSRS